MSRQQREAPELEAMMVRMHDALVRRCGDGELEALEALDNLVHEAHAALTLGVWRYRESPAQPSWTDVGRILGLTRQAAQQRFGQLRNVDSAGRP